MRRLKQHRSGLTLLEVLVALAIVGAIAAGFAGAASQQLHSIRRAQDLERQVARAAQAMAQVTTMARANSVAPMPALTRRGLRIRTMLVAPSIYEITVSDSSGVRPLLRTSIYLDGGP